MTQTQNCEAPMKRQKQKCEEVKKNNKLFDCNYVDHVNPIRTFDMSLHIYSKNEKKTFEELYDFHLGIRFIPPYNYVLRP